MNSVKNIILKSLLFISLNSFSQKAKIIGHITNVDTLNTSSFWVVTLKLGDSSLNEISSNSEFNFDVQSFGVYSVIIHQIGQNDLIVKNIKVYEDTTIYLKLTFPPPCTYKYLEYLRKGRPTCSEGGHRDKIIPIVYGLPSLKLNRKIKKDKIYLGGCVVNDCAPHYYCKKHQVKL